MDNIYTGESYEEKHPKSTPTLSNDSGYITTTPSTLCNDSLDKISINDISTREPNDGIYETPPTSQKNGKLSSLRKNFGEHYSSLKLENVNECVEDCSRCSCASAVDEKDARLYSPVNERNGNLAECFSHLLVDESMCERNTIAEMCNSREEKSVLRSKSEIKSFVNSKKKSGISLEKVAAKKFKQDIGLIRGKSESLGHCSPRHCNYCGVSRFDFLAHFAGVSGSFPVIISRILSYLPPEDLVTVCLVSSEWRRICVDDPVANRRRLAHVRHVEHAKENITWEKFKQSGNSLNLTLVSGKGVFREIQNTDRRGSNSSTPSSPPRSPPVSPSKVRFKLFFKAGIALDEGTHLIRCPRCSHPSQATSDHARCQAVGCQYSFCVFCLCDIHEGLPCPGRSPLPVRRKICIGSKESRRNLRRL